MKLQTAFHCSLKTLIHSIITLPFDKITTINIECENFQGKAMMTLLEGKTNNISTLYMLMVSMIKNISLINAQNITLLCEESNLT